LEFGAVTIAQFLREFSALGAGVGDLESDVGIGKAESAKQPKSSFAV
jgi:hypothetical protein